MATGTIGVRLLSMSVGALLAGAAVPAAAQQQGRGPSPAMREAARLDLEGKTSEARRIIQAAIDSAANPEAKAAAQRQMAMSYAFDGDCPNTLKYEQMGIDYWKTREAAAPQDAFYQEGELADEGARVCIDAGDLASAEKWYRLGYALGMREPAPMTHPQALWDFRLAHALGRIAARRGDRAEAAKQVAAARLALDSDTAVARQQERFFPYLTGYVALYTNDLARAQADLEKAVALKGNQRDPFMLTLLAMTYEKRGKKEQAAALYRKAYELARAHNPPSAFVRPFVRKKLGLAAQ